MGLLEGGLKREGAKLNRAFAAFDYFDTRVDVVQLAEH